MALRELAAAWLRANCPNRAVHTDFLKQLDRAVARGVGCTFLVGRELTKRAKPKLVACHCGELFAFDLTREQAKQLQMRSNMLVCSLGLVKQDHVAGPEPPVALEDVAVDNAAAVNRELPITGTLRYRATRLFLESLAVQVACEPSGRTNKLLYHHFLELRPPEGAIRFVLGNLGDLLSANGEPFVGALPLFFRIVATGLALPETALPGIGVAGVGMPPASPQSPFKMARKPPLPPQAPIVRPAMPARPPFPTPFDPRSPTVSVPMETKALSDLRAVLVDVV